MQVRITTRHGSIRDEVREHIERKSEKLLTFFERVTEIAVAVDFENDRIRAEILVDTEHRHNFVAHDQGDEVIPTFDAAFHKMEQQIKKYKQKLQDHRRDVPLSTLSNTEDAEDELPETD